MGELGSPWVLPVALLVGALIGSVGIGGVLLPPALIFLDGMNAHVAIATSIWSFFFAALAGTVIYLRRGNVDRRAVALLMTTIIPGAVGGALASNAVPSVYLTLGLAGLVLVSGGYTLIPRSGREGRAAQLQAGSLMPTGAVVGFGSAFLGSSGPIFLVPVLLVMQVEALMAIGISQVIQLPIIIFATATFATRGSVNFLLGLVLGVPLVLGVAVGARVAHTVQPVVLRRTVAVALVGAGVLMGVRVLAGQ